MKQLTIDFELYEKELLAAKREGAEVIDRLHKRLKAALDDLDGYDGSRYQNALYDLRTILAELDRVKK